MDEKEHRATVLHFFNRQEIRSRTARATKALRIIWELLFHRPNRASLLIVYGKVIMLKLASLSYTHFILGLSDSAIFSHKLIRSILLTMK